MAFNKNTGCLNDYISKDISFIHEFAEKKTINANTSSLLYSCFLTLKFQDYYMNHNKEIHHLIKDKGVEAYKFTLDLMSAEVKRMMCTCKDLKRYD